METGLLFLVIGFLVLVYLIFKFIKKAIFAVIAVVAVLVLIFGGTIGLVYLDLNNLASQTDYQIEFVLSEDGEYLLGASVPITNQNVDLESVEGISRTEINEIDVESYEDEENKFLVEIDKDFLESIMVDKYEIEGIELPEEFADYDVSLTKEEVLSLMDVGSDSDELVDILFDKNNVSGLVATIGKPVLAAQVDSYIEERNMTFRTAVFLIALTGSIEKESNILKLIEGYKNDGAIEIYPDRFTFSLVRMLPASFIMGFIEEDTE
jgi:energy-coupling factor transporter transmembrane protein EcfT